MIYDSSFSVQTYGCHKSSVLRMNAALTANELHLAGRVIDLL